MEMKPREIPYNLQMRRLLQPRMQFSEKELKQLLKDEKGYEGECYFDRLITNSAASTYLRINGILLQWNDNLFEIDSLLFSPFKIYLSDVKTFEGEYYIEGDQWFFISGDEVKNPILQLRRSETLLRQLLKSLGINLPIQSQVVFVQPNFTLFQADKNLPVVLPTQLNSFIKGLKPVNEKFQPNLIKAVEKLAALHINDSPFKKKHIPEYTYESLKKGIPCKRCKSLSVRLKERELMCDQCDYTEDLDAGVIRLVEEFKLLFPERLITVSNIMDWIGLNINRNRLSRILKKHYQMVGNGRSTYYQ
ncbi:MAG: NERD domain-containing protein [Tuberibacillus sp.]